MKSTVFAKTITKTIAGLLVAESKNTTTDLLKKPLQQLLKTVYNLLHEDIYIGALAPYRRQLEDLLR